MFIHLFLSVLLKFASSDQRIRRDLDVNPRNQATKPSHLSTVELDVGNIPSYELQALEDFYYSTDGQTWIWNAALGNQWNFSSNNANPCLDNWQGIVCDESSSPYHVINLVLENANLTGPFPESIGNLSELIGLQLDNNHLSGELPSSLANCTKIQNLILSYNALEGTIPDFVNSWSALRYFEVNGNFFTGTISPGHCELHNLLVYNVGSNYLEGEIPDCFENTLELLYFYVPDNYLVGTLPHSLGNLTAMLYLAPYENFLTGPIPENYGNLHKMQKLFFFQNMLTGTIPSSFLSMKDSLLDIDFGNNPLTGTLPNYLCSMLQLQFIDFSDTGMNGTLPNCLGNLLNNQRFYLFDMHLTGTIPASLANCSQLYFIGFYNNFLTGTIPASLAALTNLEYLEINDNQLSGPIPDIFNHMPYLYALYTFRNALTGPLPPSLGNCSAVAYLNTQINMLTGSFPRTFFDKFNVLYSFDVSSNELTGSVPTSVGRVSSMQYFNIFDNQFMGSIPESMGYLDYLQFLFVDENYLTGSIPSTFGHAVNVEQFIWDYNLISGSIPPEVGNIYYLQFFSVEFNALTGTLPSTFSGLTYLIEMIVNNNHLTGILDQAFNATIQYELATVVLNNNRFSGTIPNEPFRLDKLNSFSGVSNCFHGELPEIICQSTTLSTLALDGLSSAVTCRKDLFPSISDSYIVTRSLSGSVPSCYYHIPTLTTLHLSGNGLTGSLPENAVNPYLVDLSLSHNVLTGTIPGHMQRRPWFNLDLSYNRLSGTLLSDFQSQQLNASFYAHLSDLIGLNISAQDAQSSLSLENNRLSGAIPQSIHDKANVSILGSNLFTCNLAATDLPKHDTGRRNYQCDSQEFNVPFYIWLSVVVAFLIGMFLVWRFQDRIVSSYGIDYALTQVGKWFSVLEVKEGIIDPKRRLSVYLKVLELSESLCKISTYATVYILVLLLPVLTTNSAVFGTFTHKYAWAVSAAYTSGVIPGILTMIFLIGLMVLTIVALRKSMLLNAIARQQGAGSSSFKKPLPLLNVVLIYTTFIFANISMVVGANAAYVYVAIYGDRNVLLLAQLTLSLFKLFWNRFFSIYLIRWTARLLTTSVKSGTSPRKSTVTSTFGSSSAIEGSTTDTSAGTSANTNAGDSEDLEDLEDSANLPELQLVSLQVFVALLNNIAIPCLVVAVISPSCFYNVFVGAPKIETVYTYQVCSLVNGAECKTFAEGSIYTSYAPPFTYNYQCSSSFITYYAPAFVLLCMMRTFLTPLLQYALYVLHRRAMSQPGGRWFKLLDLAIPANLKPLDFADDIKSSVYKPYFDANQMVLSLVTYMGLLLTFGAVFPPVAVALLVTLFSVLYFNKLKMGRYLTIAAEKGLFGFIDIVEVESKRAGFLPIIGRSMWMLITISCWFYTLFLFDTLGDAVGFDGAYWVLIVMPLMPALLYVLHLACDAYIDSKGKASSDTVSIESGGVTMNVLREKAVELPA